MPQLAKLPFQTDRLVLRRIKQPDTEFLAELWSNPMLRTGMLLPNSYERAKSHAEHWAKVAVNELGQLNHIVIQLQEPNSLVGHICCTIDVEKAGCINQYSLDPAFWGNGYMTESAQVVRDCLFSSLNAEVVSAECNLDNTRSLRVLTNIGMRLSGKFRSSTYVITRDEWLIGR